MVLESRFLGVVVWGCGVLVMTAIMTSFGGMDAAKAQYRAGAFVNGKPVFAQRRPARRLMHLRARRSRVRTRNRTLRKVARPARSAPIATGLQGRRLAAPMPPLPVHRFGVGQRVRHAAVLAMNQTPKGRQRQRAVTRKPVMQIVVSLDRQRLTVYEDGRVIRRSAVSSGKAGHRTPTGVFSIIQKRRHHRSNIYSGAPMPYMQRITWSGIALHEGRLPGYAASHGCVRLPRGFARRLFKATAMRTHVVVAKGNLVPRPFAHANLPGVADLDDVELAVLAGGATGTSKQPPARPLSAPYVPVKYVTGDYREIAPAPHDPEVYALAAMLHADQSDMLAHRHRVTRTRNDAPLRVLVTRRTQRDQIRDVQRQFMALGYDVGELDGRLGRQTIAVVKAFQRAQKLRVTGQPDAATRDLLDVVTEMPRPAAGTVYVRQNGRQIYSGTIEFMRPSEPVGTHLYTLVDLAGGAWTAMTVQRKGRLPSWSKRSWQKRLGEIAPVTATQAIERIRFPAHVRAVIEDRLTPGSSLIIADRGSEQETGIATDFVVLTDR